DARHQTQNRLDAEAHICSGNDEGDVEQARQRIDPRERRLARGAVVRDEVRGAGGGHAAEMATTMPRTSVTEAGIACVICAGSALSYIAGAAHAAGGGQDGVTNGETSGKQSEERMGVL